MQIQLFNDESAVCNDKYNKKILAPQYVPKKDCPPISALFNATHFSSLVKNIKDSTVTEEEKEFLLKAATRHLQFNYDKIADYYAHATPEMQKLMEQSALVIIDFNDAIANGYIQLSSTIKSIVAEDVVIGD